MHVIKTMRAVLGRQYTDTAVCHFLACELRLLHSTQEVCSLAKPFCGLVANKALLCQHMWPDGLQMHGGAVSHDVSACHQCVSVITNQLSSWKLGILRMK